MIIVDCKQNSPEWDQCRLGIPTASNFGKILTATGKVSAQRQDYMYDLAGEAVSGRHEETFNSFRMQQGSEKEAESRMVYAMDSEVEVRQVGFVYKDERRMFGCSPDGLIDPDGGFESKDAKFKVQIKRLLDGKMVTEHIPQVQGGLYVCEREWWLFRSYCSDLPSLNIRCERDEAYISRLAEELEKFCYELAGLIKKLREMGRNEKQLLTRKHRFKGE